jgi:crotonyl-CoA reductase
MTAAVLAGASADDLERCPLPEFTRGLCIRREDETMFDGVDDAAIDVRDSLHLDTVPLPRPAADEVVIAVMASAINYNTVWSAKFRPMSTFRFLDRLGRESPAAACHAIDHHVLGSDASGIVVRTGANVRHWRVGDHVVVNTLQTDEQDPIAQWDGMLPEVQRAWGFETNYGGLAEYSLVKATQLLPKPAHLTWEEAACNTLCLMTAYRMLISAHGARVTLGDLVLIWGATGGLGAYGTQLAKAAGCRVVGVVSSPRKAELASALGCDLVINREDAVSVHPDGFRSPKTWKWLGSEIRAVFGSDPDHVFEHVGRETFAASVFVARRGGTVVTCGSSTGFEHEFDNRYLWMKLKRIIGSHGANYHESAEATRLLARGTIVPALSEVYPLDDAAEATRAVQQNEHIGKVGVLCLAPEEGAGITDPQFRATVGEERLRLFRSDTAA